MNKIKEIINILALVDKSNIFKIILISLFFVINALFQLLFVLSFYLLVQSFTEPNALMQNNAVLALKKFFNIKYNNEFSDYFVIIFFVIVIFSNIIFILSNFLKFNFSFILLTKLRSKFCQFCKKK